MVKDVLKFPAKIQIKNGVLTWKDCSEGHVLSQVQREVERTDCSVVIALDM